MREPRESEGGNRENIRGRRWMRELKELEGGRRENVRGEGEGQIER